MIDKLIVRPILMVATWVKRHPLLAAIALVFLFLLPPAIIIITGVLNSMLRVISWVFKAVSSGQELGEQAHKLLEKIYSAFQKFLLWLQEKPSRCYWLAFGVSILVPLAGAALAVWCFLDQFKTGEHTAKLELDNRTSPPPEVEPPAPDVGQVLPDIVLPDFRDYV